MLLRIPREDHYFDLGLEVGNVDAYCALTFDLVMEAIAQERRSQVMYEYPGNYAYNYLQNSDRVVARYAFLVGHKFDHERIMEDINELYRWLADPMDECYPDWWKSCPGNFRFTLTPGYFEFAVGE